jgi:hypothetical protein
MSWRCALTKVPRPAARVSTPSNISSRKARLAVMRLTPKEATSSCSEETRSPGFNAPRSISARICSLIRR